MQNEQFDAIRNNLYSWEDMSWTTRQYSKGEINRAGNALITLPLGNPVRDNALNVIDNWRSCHAYPLQVIKMNLLQKATRIDKGALISQRLKRLPSIALKLKQNEHMKLSQMQDIGGCRAVLRGFHQMHKLHQVYERAKSKESRFRSQLVEKYDYISTPKDDGYRGIHLVYKYQSDSPNKADFNGQRIEMQIRSKLQHFWATAVETAQVFTGQALKSRIKDANESWLRFFALMGSAIAAEETQALVPNTPSNKKEWIKELREIIDQEKILDCLAAWNTTIRHSRTPRLLVAHAFLLVLNPTRQLLEVSPFRRDQLGYAQDLYLKKEKEFEHDPQIQVVLVSVDSISALRKAYPNYYIDTKAFIKVVEREISSIN